MDHELNAILSVMHHEQDVAFTCDDTGAAVCAIGRGVNRLEAWMDERYGPEWKSHAPSNDVF